MLRDAVASIDAGTMSGADAERMVAALTAVSKTADAGVAVLARRLEETARWKHAQSPSAEAHLGALMGGSAAEGRRLLETSRRLDDLPATRQAMADGQLSAEQAGLIAAAAGELADAGRADEAEAAEQHLLAVAGRGNFGSLRTAAEQARQAARDEAAQREHLHKTRFLHKRRFDDGGLGGTFKLEPGVAVELYALLDAECERQFRIARAEGRREGHEAYAVDASVELVGRGGARPRGIHAVDLAPARPPPIGG